MRPLVSTERAGSLDLMAEGQEKFPFDAFAFDRGAGKVYLRSPWVFSLPGLVSYASNALAVAAGLKVGDLYRQGDLVAVVH